MENPLARERKSFECNLALKESCSDTSIPVLVHGKWKGKGKVII
jgi:hypothetical protein